MRGIYLKCARTPLRTMRGTSPIKTTKTRTHLPPLRTFPVTAIFTRVQVYCIPKPFQCILYIWFPALSLKTLKMPDFYRLMNNLPDADASPSLKVLQTSIQSARSHTLSFQVTLLTIPKAKHVLKLLQPLPIDTTQRGLLQGGHKVPGQVFFCFFLLLYVTITVIPAYLEKSNL